MRGTVIQKSMGSNDATGDNGDSPRGSGSPNWRSCISTMSLSRVARIGKIGRKDGGSVSSAMTEKARCGRVQWKALTKRDVRRIGRA